MALTLSLEASPVGKNFASLVENVRRPAGIEEKSLSALWGSAASMSLLDPNERIYVVEKKKKYVRTVYRVVCCFVSMYVWYVYNSQYDDGRRIVGSKHEEKMCNNAHWWEAFNRVESRHQKKRPNFPQKTYLITKAHTLD